MKMIGRRYWKLRALNQHLDKGPLPNKYLDVQMRTYTDLENQAETVVEDFTVALMHEKIKTQNLKVISPEKLAELNKLTD